MAEISDAEFGVLPAAEPRAPAPAPAMDDAAFMGPQTSATPARPVMSDEDFGVETQSPGVLDLLGEVGKRFASGAIETAVASPLRGLGAATAPDITRLENTTPSTMAGLVEEQIQPQPTVPRGTPTKDTSLYRAGEAVSDWTKETLPDRKLLNPVVGDVAAGFGSLAGNLVPALVPFVGPAVATMNIPLGSVGEAAERAIKAGANEEQIQRASALGTVPGSTEFLDFLLLSGGSTGRTLGMINRIGLKVLQGAFIEGGQEGFQQFLHNAIAKGVYKPDQDLVEDVPYNAFIGAVVGGAAKPILDRGTQTPETPPTPEQIEATFGVVPVEAQPLATQPKLDAPTQPTFYSTLLRATDKLPESASPEQMLATLKNQAGVKEEEIAAVGLPGFLASQEGRVSKADLVAHIEENQVQVEETLRTERTPNVMEPNWTVVGGGANSYEEYTAPGERTGYRELLLTLPDQPGADRTSTSFKSSHWREQNVVSHVRFTDRVDRAGKPVLHIEEIQSDWHQTGRKKGYRGSPSPTFEEALVAGMIPIEELGPGAFRAVVPNIDSRRIAIRGNREGAIEEARTWYEAQRANMNAERPPDAPFKTSWPELTFKRILRWAADNGYSRISWNTGEMAATHAAGDPQSQETRAGLREFYDRIIPSIAKKWGKKIGGQLGVTEIVVSGTPRFEVDYQPTDEQRQQVPSLGWGIYDNTNGTFQHIGLAREAEAAVAQLPIETVPTTQRVMHLEVPESARSYIQAGLPLFKRSAPEIALDIPKEGSERYLQVTPQLRAQVNKMMRVVADVAKRFKINQKITFEVLDTVIYSGREVKGLMSSMSDGSFRIRLNISTMSNLTDFYSTAMHEFGHVVHATKFNELSDADKRLIRMAHNKFLMETVKAPNFLSFLRRRNAAVDAYFMTRPHQEALTKYSLRDLSPEDRHYWSGFEEWFAEQTARWATSPGPALTAVESIFKRMADVMLDVFVYMSKRLGLNFRAAPVMQAWFDSFLDTSGPYAGATFSAVDAKGQLENNNILIKIGHDGVPAPPQEDVNLGPRTAINNIFGGSGNVPVQVREMEVAADRFHWLYEWFGTLSHLVDANPRFIPLLRYNENIRMMHSDAAQWHDVGTRVAKDMAKLGRQRENLFALIDDLTNMRYRTDDEIKRGIARHPTNAERDALIQKYKVSNEALRVLEKINVSLAGMLDAHAKNAYDAAARVISDPVKLAQAADEIAAWVRQLKGRPYFPFMRFGRHFVTVRNRAGKVIEFKTFERLGLASAQARQQSYLKQTKEVLRQRGLGETVTDGILPENVEPLLGMSPVLLQHMKEEMNLTPDQLDALEQLQFHLTPELSFKHHFQHKNYTPGYSMDFQRAYSRYMFHGANFYGKMKYLWRLRENIKEADAVGGNLAHRIRDFMKDHLQNTILDIRSDWNTLKGATFIWAMGYVPAAATQNLSQTPMITFPFLAGKFGDARAGVAILNAMRKISTFYKKGKYDNATAFEMRAFEYGIKTGRISETQAADLAGLAQGSNLWMAGGGNTIQRGWTEFMSKAAWMFETAEQFNRRIAFRAGLELATKNPTNKMVEQAVNKYNEEYQHLTRSGYSEAEARAIVAAVHVVDQTQYVYARYNRARFMRGQMGSLIFMFQTYFLNTLWMLGSNKRDVMWRYMLVALLIGGASGVPGWEDWRELIRGIGRWKFGKDYNIDLEVREYVNQLANGKIPPDLILHGFSRKGFGLPAILDAMGSLYTGKPGRGLSPNEIERASQTDPTRFNHSVNVPFPVLDRSRALTMGHLLPLEVGKMLGPSKDANAVIGDQTQKASGAVFSVGFNIYKAIMDNHLGWSDPKRWERAVPRLLARTSMMFRSYAEGRERTGNRQPGSAATVVDYNTRDPEHLMELLAIGAGYETLRRSAFWNQEIARLEYIKFVEIQKKGLMEQMFEAERGGHPEEIGRVRDAIVEFNQRLPDHVKPMGISTDGLRKSMQARARELAAREGGYPTQRTKAGVYHHFQGLFPEAIDVRRVR